MNDKKHQFAMHSCISQLYTLAKVFARIGMDLVKDVM